VVDDILQEHPDLQFQQDNVKFTKSMLEAAGIKTIKWPPCSPHLNPIETIWDNMNEYIQQHYPQAHSLYEKLRGAIQEV
jgi:transposase